MLAHNEMGFLKGEVFVVPYDFDAIGLQQPIRL